MDTVRLGDYQFPKLTIRDYMRLEDMAYNHMRDGLIADLDAAGLRGPERLRAIQDCQDDRGTLSQVFRFCRSAQGAIAVLELSAERMNGSIKPDHFASLDVGSSDLMVAVMQLAHIEIGEPADEDEEEIDPKAGGVSE